MKEDRCPYCKSEFSSLVLCSPPKRCKFMKACSNVGCKSRQNQGVIETFGEWFGDITTEGK